MKYLKMLFELWDFSKERKAWWLAPVMSMLILMSLLIMEKDETK